ncbi:MAG TPA: serine protease [Methylomirabilota bacterium]|jgi:S1-C subfamily serine protease|nr:serine protease [Methylomirabilota bacterium]
MLREIALGAMVVALLGGCGVAKMLEPSREQMLQRILPSAVQIVIEQKEGRRVRTGSGVVLASRQVGGRQECFILTSGHTMSGIAGQKEVYVVFGRDQGDAKKARASIVTYRDTPEVDLALLRVDDSRCVPARAGGSALLGESVWVVGFPWGRHMTLASGIVSQVNIDGSPAPETASRLMVDAPVSYGSSGGGVFETRRGRLIGVVEGYNTARVSSQGANPPWYIDVPVPGQTFVTPLSAVKRFLADAGYAELAGAQSPPRRLTGVR